MRSFLLAGVVFLACGGAVDPATVVVDTGAADDPPAFVWPPDYGTDPPPFTPPPSSYPPPTQLMEPPAPGTANFHLVVWNRVGAPLPMDFWIDGAKVVTGGFSNHNPWFDFALAPGKHVIDIHAAQSLRSLPKREVFSFEITAEHWGTVDVTAARCDPCSPAWIEWKLHDKMPGKL